MKLLNTFFALPLLALLSGCNFELGRLDGSTAGAKGNAAFSISSQGCLLLGCPLDRPLMTGTIEDLSISSAAADASLPSGLVASVEVAGVAHVAALQERFVCCVEGSNSAGCFSVEGDGASCNGRLTRSYVARLTALSAGATSLVLRASDGTVFDTLPLQVADPATLGIDCTVGGSPPQVSAIDLASGQSCQISISAFSATGAALIADAGFDIQIGDPTVAALQSTGILDFDPTEYDEIAGGSDGAQLTGKAPGKTKLLITTGSLQDELAITVH